MARGPDPKSRLAPHAPGVPGDESRDELRNDPRLLGDCADAEAASPTPVLRPKGPMPSLGRTLRGASPRTPGPMPAGAGGTRAAAGPADADRLPRSHAPVSGEGDRDDL